MLRFYPSTIAASVVHLAMKASDTYADATWTPALEEVTRHNRSALAACEAMIVERVRKGETCSLKAAKKKHRGVASFLTPLLSSLA